MPELVGPVIANTGPVSALALLDRLAILSRLYGEVLIPEGVMRELHQGPGAQLRASRVSGQEGVRVVQLARPASARLLMELDQGEAEVISLAEERGASLVIIDEALAREYASVLGFRVTGTVGVPLRARREGLVSAVRPLLTQLRDGGYRLSERLVAWALTEAGEG
ncbi:MAG: DUF3368 domain-containing protein [Candidatus Riflebacteria bacterium]|nr:DUF3368 domain-containing protein [Candidatus Riflebacteria bacterium]